MFGYVTAGSWAGITIGGKTRPPSARLSSRKRIFVYTVVVGVVLSEFILESNDGAVAIVSLLLGLILLCAAAVFMRNMSRSKNISGMGII